jgi:23S rRNA (adenine2503-C2)-methyltransferase
MQTPTHRNLVGASRAEIAALLDGLDSRPYRVEQVHRWLARRLAGAIEDMTDLPKNLREGLALRAVVRDPEVADVRRGTEGTAKFALAYPDGAVVEAVTMPMEGHTTLCLSSQAGCAVGCVFCVTGILGSGRNLTGGEIFGQYRRIMRDEGLVGTSVNVVFMGMGEPLLNVAGVTRAVELLSETVSPRRVTVSTSGIVPGLAALAALERRPKLAVSLNATTQEQRRRLMPVAARWTLDELLAALRAFPLERGRRITFEYVMISGINDSLDDARRLPRLLRGIPCKVNLIPLNPDERYLAELCAPDEETIDAFAGVLAAAHMNVTVRWSKGRDVAAACGQLRGQLSSAGRPAGGITAE